MNDDRLPHGNLDRPLTDQEKLARIQWWLDHVNARQDSTSEWSMGFETATWHVEYLLQPDYYVPPDTTASLEEDPFEYERPPALPPKPLSTKTPTLSIYLTDIAAAYTQHLNKKDPDHG